MMNCNQTEHRPTTTTTQTPSSRPIDYDSHCDRPRIPYIYYSYYLRPTYRPTPLKTYHLLLPTYNPLLPTTTDYYYYYYSYDYYTTTACYN